MKLRNEITKEQIDKAYKLAKEGHTLKVICISVGVSYQSYALYKSEMLKGNEVKPDHLEFLDSIERGMNEYFLLCEDMVNVGMSTDPKFALEILARRKHKEWGRKDKIEQKIKHSGSINTNVKFEVIGVENTDTKEDIDGISEI